MQKSYCYTPSVRIGVCVGVRMQNVRASVKVMKLQSLCIFTCILTLLIIQIKTRTTIAHDRRASGDCGTSGLVLLNKYLSTYGFSHRNLLVYKQGASNQCIPSYIVRYAQFSLSLKWSGLPGHQKSVVTTSPVSIHLHWPSCIWSVNPIQ